tara:strand:+ start:679 stop:1002 length:324 start_codon:yes stop_codon:yes gene_type:complete
MDSDFYNHLFNTMKEIIHPIPKDQTKYYVNIAILLAGITFFEVYLYYTPKWNIPILLIFLSLIKFSIVVGYFMHLKYENKLIKLFYFIGFLLSIPWLIILFFERGLL